MGQANMPGNLMPAANMLGLVNLMNQGLLPGQVMGNTTNPMVGSLLETANVMGLASMANPAGMMGLVNMLGAGNLASPGNVLLSNPLLAAQGGFPAESGVLPPGALLASGQLAQGIIRGGMGLDPMMSNNDGLQSGQGVMKQPPSASGGAMHMTTFPAGSGGGQEGRPARFNRGPGDSDYPPSGTSRTESDYSQAGPSTSEVWGAGRPPGAGPLKGQDSQRDKAFERNWRSQAPGASAERTARQEAGYGGPYADSGESRKDDHRRDERSRRPDRDSRHEERAGRSDDRERSSRHGREEQRDRKAYGDMRGERGGPAGRDYGGNSDAFPGGSK
jgi:hypothetical protein